MSELPKNIGKYEIRGVVGRGAMGVVYSAVDPTLGRTVAIKTMSVGASSPDSELWIRFLREARSAGRLQHPNIITVHELVEENRSAFLVMELLEGASLSSLLRRKKKLSTGQRLSIVDQIAAGLGEAHAHGIVHRDLKPSNVFVLRSGIVKVLDFGVAKVGEGELTKAGTVFGTIEYMAPEQVRGASVTPQADIFSLGVVAYEIFSGRNPFRADTLAASVFKIVSDTPEPLAEVPPEVNELVFRALGKEQASRFSSLAELRASLAEVAGSAGLALSLPALDDEDVVTAKESGDASLMSVEPRVSQWSHVAAQADLLEELYQQGVAAFGRGSYEECIEKMSLVLDDVPVHTMSLHYLAMAEEKLRRKRLSPTEHREATRVLGAMRDAHRRGEAQSVLDQSNELLRIDKESLEARWYRRHAEARLRGVSVGVTRRGGTNATASRRGAVGGSFGYVPPERRGPRSAPSPPALGTLSPGTSGSRAPWLLGGVGLVFLSLLVVWLGFIGDTRPSVSASKEPAELPGVRTSPFDEIDEDGTVVLQLPRAPGPPFGVHRVIPTSVPVGKRATLGVFGEGFTEEMELRVEALAAEIVSTRLVDAGRLEIDVQVSPRAERVEIVLSRGGRESRITLEVF